VPRSVIVYAGTTAWLRKLEAKPTRITADRQAVMKCHVLKLRLN